MAPVVDGSAPCPRRRQDQPPPSLPRQLQPPLRQPANKKLLFACLILDYRSISCSPGELVCTELVASALPLSLAAEAEPPPGFDPALCSFDGQRPAGGQKKKKKGIGKLLCVFLESVRLS